MSTNETTILKLMDKVEETNKKVSAIEDRFKEYDNKIKDYETKIEDFKSSVNDNKSQLEQKRKELFEKLQPRTQKIYNRIKNAKGIPVLACISNNSCSVCNIDIPAQTVNDVRQENRIYTCDSCNRILYWQEDSEK
jgi:hypothetical protein